MMFIIFIIITYTRDKNCQLTSWRWKVLLNNLFFLWGGGGGGEGASFLQKTLAYFRPKYVNFPCLKRARNLTLFQAQTVAIYTHFHTKTFSFQKKNNKNKKKTLWHPQKGSPPPPPSGPPKLLKYSKLKRRTRCHSRQFLW